MMIIEIKLSLSIREIIWTKYIFKIIHLLIHTNPTNDVGFNQIFLAFKIQGSTYHES